MRQSNFHPRMAIAILAMGLLASTPAFAQNKLRPVATAAGLIDASDPGALLAIAKENGNASLGKDQQGDPQITGEADGYAYLLTFYDCTDARDCRAVMFDTTFDDADVSDDIHNLWNRDNLVGTSMPGGEGGARLYYSITLDGGIAPATMGMHFARWRKAMGSYVTFLKENL